MLEPLLLKAVAVAQSARDNGNHPFGALLADGSGEVLLSAENTVVTESDATGHAETISYGSRPPGTRRLSSAR